MGIESWQTNLIKLSLNEILLKITGDISAIFRGVFCTSILPRVVNEIIHSSPAIPPYFIIYKHSLRSQQLDGLNTDLKNSFE